MALEDLKNAGLPKTTDALVMTMADAFLLPPIDEEIDTQTRNHATELPGFNRDFHHAVPAFSEEFVGFTNLVQCESVRK